MCKVIVSIQFLSRYIYVLTINFVCFFVYSWLSNQKTRSNFKDFNFLIEFWSNHYLVINDWLVPLFEGTNAQNTKELNSALRQKPSTSSNFSFCFLPSSRSDAKAKSSNKMSERHWKFLSMTNENWVKLGMQIIFTCHTTSMYAKYEKYFFDLKLFTFIFAWLLPILQHVHN